MEHKRSIPLIIVAACLIFSLTGISTLGRAKGLNLSKEEMLALDPAFKKIIDAVVMENLKIIKPALADLHEAREEVERAVKAGQKIALPKNQDKLKEFIELDDRFHEEFEVLEKAAEAGNKKVVQQQTHKLLDACVVCHERFAK